MRRLLRARFRKRVESERFVFGVWQVAEISFVRPLSELSFHLEPPYGRSVSLSLDNFSSPSHEHVTGL